MGKVIMSGIVPQLVAPKKPGLELSTIAEGSIVKLNENGSPVEFYVAKHNYESGLNGAGRTLLVRKDTYMEGTTNTVVWDSDNTGVYPACTLDGWFNSTYKAVLDDAVQTAIGTTNIYCGTAITSLVVASCARGIFALSMTELGFTDSNYIPVEGSALPIASKLLIAYFNGTATGQASRTYYRNNGNYYFLVNRSGSKVYRNKSSSEGYPRPAFTLPSTAKFDAETLLFKGVS